MAKPRGESLHIGLNSVSGAHYGGWTGDLLACEADAEDMYDLARGKGFSATKLMTKKGTRKAVVDALTSAAGRLRSGDIFFLSYSGHGGRLPDKNDDEPDNMDETWCLYDGEIIDDEMNNLYAKFAKGVRIVVLSDSCHSGTVTKMAFYESIRDSIPSGDGAVRYRAMPPAAELRTYRLHRAFYDKLQKANAKAADVKATVLLISGCQDSQLSADGTFNGLFTGTLLKVWKDGAFQGDYRKFHRDIRNRMPPYQAPNLFVTGGVNAAFAKEPPFKI
jgi:hypothetical protein